ncbi:type I-F CRISPR-associated protein Csy1 [Erwinia sp. PsM31]|uniref:type I-F CRISPR-associated protein Csy1 n=1 Tax=Erwinia sp. PsM31 TaxID=3030535 RepID=UPI00263B286D|nr:type I-F CRISPR-associated protein Csy1 [Erwinia sp. PsM31]MDN4626707.1 type I-F CRISPR-associated protein Csy1 [Erwinia sp. PsM31]
MPEKGLTSFIIQYIAERKQPKREALEKEEVKALAGAGSPAKQAAIKNDYARQYAELDEKYEVRNWLSDAARRASQISLITHALKFTHSDAKGSSIYQTSGDKSPDYLSSGSLKNPLLDAVGNAASLDIAKLLQTEYQGDSLIASLIRNDTSALAKLAENEQQLAEWISGFKQVLTSANPASHKLAKQIYFPIGDGHYHLISPLFATSLAHALHERLTTSRFSEEAKEINAAVKAGTWHSQPRTTYLQTALQKFGGTKPQNISYLNSARGGRVRLLSSAAPVWQSINKPPLQHKTIFHFRSEFAWLARASVAGLKRHLLSGYTKQNNEEIRQQRLSYVDEIIDILFNYVTGIQQPEFANWSKDTNCELKRSQQLWLDPLRSKADEHFRFEREAGDWQKEVARDFGYWLSRQLSVNPLNMGEVERRYFSTAALFKKRLREMEQDLKEELL